MNGKKPADIARSLLASRRAFLVAGAGAAVGAAGVAAILGRKPDGTTQIGSLDANNATPLGDGFYLADGWVLTAEDLGVEPAATGTPGDH